MGRAAAVQVHRVSDRGGARNLCEPEDEMNCPHCTVPLVMSERQGVEIDYCPQCRGVWLDRGELDKIIERQSAFEQQAVRPPPQQAPAVPAYGHSQQPPPYGAPRHRDDDDGDDDDDRRRHGGQGGGHYPQRKKSWLSELFD